MRSNRFRESVLGIFWITMALFLFLALWSYDRRDPSINSLGYGGMPRNLCGYVGSYISDILFQSIGFAAWTIPGLCLRSGVLWFTKQKSSKTIADVFVGICLVINVAALLECHFQVQTLNATAISMGGALGYIVHSGLKNLLNSTGVTLILWSTGITLLMFVVEKTPQELFHNTFVASSLLRKKLSSVWSFVSARFRPVSRVRQRETSIANHDFQSNPALKSTEAIFPLIAARKDSESDSVKPEKNSTLKAIRRIENWELPKLNLLEKFVEPHVGIDQKQITKNIKTLVEKLAQFSVKGEVVAVKPGPAVTMYEFKPNADVKISKITELADDLSLALSSESLRIIAPIPGRDVVGIETSNIVREKVYLRETLEDQRFWDSSVKLPLVLGKQADGATHIEDLRKMPHLLVAGSTGSGKSVFILAAITSLLFRHSPKTLRLILIDPKQVDLAAFEKVPHLLMPPVREPRKAVVALKWAIREMEKRYRSLSRFESRGLEGFNETVSSLSKEDIEKNKLINEEIEATGKPETFYYQPLPYIVIVVEEFGDLMSVDKANVEQAVVRLAQMARASGIHLVLAMQSPRKDVVTGLIKTNIPGRISFKVASKMDSRIILEESGAERLLSGGDMLFLAPGISKPMRHHGAWIPEKEVSAVAQYWSEQGGAEYDRSATTMLDNVGGRVSSSTNGESTSGEGSDGSVWGDEGIDTNPNDDDIFDEKYDEILSYVSTQKEVSASFLQRRFRLGYPRAARMIEVFEKEGVIGPANGSKPRTVLVSKL